jgi:hypothetical protein
VQLIRQHLNQDPSTQYAEKSAMEPDIPVMVSKLTGHAKARADINSVDGCLSFSGSISIQFTDRKAANDLDYISGQKQ